MHRESRMRAFFHAFDKDGNGHIEASELQAVFAEMKRLLSDQEAARMITLMDKNKDGKVQYDEFIGYMFGDQSAQAQQ